MKTIVVIAIISVAVVGIILGLVAYSYTQIQINLDSVSYQGLDFVSPSGSTILKLVADFITGNWLGLGLTLVTGVKLGLVFGLSNHGFFPVYIPDVSYDILVNNVKVGQGQSHIGSIINPGETRNFRNNTQDIQFGSIEPAITSIVDSGGIANFQISGTAYFIFLGMSIPVPFESSKQVNVTDEIKNHFSNYLSQNQQNSYQQNQQQNNAIQGAPSVPCPTSGILQKSQTQPISYSFVQSTINPSIPSITVSTDKNSYMMGDTMVVSGQVKAVVTETPLTIQILDSNDNLVQLAQIDISSDGRFTKSFLVSGPSWTSNGIYTVKAQYGLPNVTAQTTFSLQGSNAPTSNMFQVIGPYSHQTFDVNYMITGGSVSDMTLDVQSNALLVTLDSTSDGTISLQIPRILLDARTANCLDDSFIILIDGAEVKPQSQSANNDYRTLTIPFLQGDKEIEIIGTQVNH